jgi:Flp pilus assembly protein TadG
MASLWQRFRTDRGGNFGIMTAILIVPLAGIAGPAVDFSNALSVRTQLLAAADAMSPPNFVSILLPSPKL